MNLKQIASNMNEVTIGSYTILFSYETPVAYKNHAGMYTVTSKKWSKTTSKHINKWLDGNKHQLVSQSVIDNLAGYLSKEYA